MTEPQLKLLRTALKTSDQTVLVEKQANPNAVFPSFTYSTANSLVARGFLALYRKTIGGTVYRLTEEGARYITAYDHT